MANVGTLTTWDEVKGFGFIRPRQGGANVFVHARDFPFYQRRPRKGDRISYTEGLGDKGRPKAMTPMIQGITSSVGELLLVSLWVLSLTCGALMFNGQLPGSFAAYVIAFYLGGSTLAFTAYIWDKQKAVAGGWRVSEATLHGLEFLGGWPAALAAQRIFRHKNRKTSYQIVFWAIVVVHLGGWSWLLFLQ